MIKCDADAKRIRCVCACVLHGLVFVCVSVLAGDSILGAEAYMQTVDPVHCIDSCQLSLQ